MGSTRPTARGVGLAVVGVGSGVTAYVIGRPELLYAAGFLVLLPIMGFVMVRRRPLRLTVTRTFSPRVVAAGTPTVIELAVRNVSKAHSPAAQWADRIPWSPHWAGPGVLPPLPAGATARRAGTLRYSLRPALRGVYDIGPLDLSFTDPFGLAIGRLVVGGRQSLYVIPHVIPLGVGLSLAISGEGSARRIQHLATGNEDDLMTREYRTGDALRRVHWRASARHGELMVRQEEQHSYPEARLILDTRSDGYDSAGSLSEPIGPGSGRFEWAITMIASVGVHLHRSGFLVRVLETGTQQIAPLGDANQRSGQEADFLLSLAAVRLLEPKSPLGGGSGERIDDTLGPVFAVVADPSSETLRWISAQRRPYERGVAFVLGAGTGSLAVFDVLEAAGWGCIPVTEADDPASVWARVSAIAAQAPAEPR
jgi:uncharacterized protein (DUF58 family)